MDRKIFLLFFLSQVAFVSLFSQNSFTLVTYNIWFDNPSNKENPWSERIIGVKKTLQHIQPDIFCVQEALINQVYDLEFLAYRYFGVGRDDGRKDGEFSAIYFDTTRYQLLEGGNFWLSESPEVPGSIGWDAACVRIATWVHLEEKNYGRSFFVFNTHFDHAGDTARRESAILLKRKIRDIAGEEPVILSGDFNCRKSSGPYQYLIESTPHLSDTRYNAEVITENPYFSFVGSDFKGETGNIIDHIFISDKLHVLRSWIWKNCNDEKCPSDHLPVVADIKFR